MAYRVKAAFQKFPYLTTTVNGKRVALVAAYEHTTTGTVTKPPEKVSVPIATQADLKQIFERGDPCIEKFEESENPDKYIPIEDYVPENPFTGVPEELIEEKQGSKKKKDERK